MKIENPYRHGAYHFAVATLLAMGINKTHKFETFVSRLEKVWNKADPEGWKAFKNRHARNEETGKDVGGRIMQNCRVLQRIKDYGRPLLKAGAVVDLIREGDKLLICLNTKSKKPQTPGRASSTSKQDSKIAAKNSRKQRFPVRRTRTGESDQETSPESVNSQSDHSANPVPNE